MALMYCYECGGNVSSTAPTCPHCGAIDPTGAGTYPAPQPERTVTYTPAKSDGVAAVLSLIIPGAGQMYKGAVGSGLLWLLVTMFGYMLFIIPGLILHLMSILNAAKRQSE